MALHADLTGADLHESKGAATASANTHATADGAGGTTWQKTTASEIDTSSIFTANKLVLTSAFVDVSTAETLYLVLPCACTLNTVYTALQGAITVADSTITIKNHGGSTAGTITVATAGSAAGDIDSVACSANNTFTSGQRISIATDGGATTAQRLFVTMVFTVTGAIT